MIKKLVVLGALLLTACTSAGPTSAPEATAGPADTASPPAPGVTDTSVPTPTLPPSAAPIPTETRVPTPGVISAPDPACCTLTPIITGLIRPVLLTHAGDERLFVVEQRGIISVFVDGVLQPFLDLQPIVGNNANEQGLLGLAFHPNYAANGFFYVNYTDNNGDTVIARYSVSADPNTADLNSAQTLLAIEQPYPNHNGGGLEFGPDGLLYIGMGDGGSAGDPRGNGQNPSVLLGKMLRLNVDDPDAGPEIWAIGLRNPWRFSFDPVTGSLFIGDVGQGDWEEIDYVAGPLPATGPNFGWNILEGTHRYSTLGDPSGLTGPIAEYSHDEGGCSVTGGYVYRGSALPALQGNYFFGDYCTGQIWALTLNAEGLWDRTLFRESGLVISSFGEDVAGELYVVDHLGDIYKLVGE